MSFLDSIVYTRAIGTYLPRIAAAKVIGRRYRRTPPAVFAEYEMARYQFLEQFRESEWTADEFVLSECDDDPEVPGVLDGRVVRGRGVWTEIRRRLLTRLHEAVSTYQASSVIEVGCGTGRNLIYLRTRRPEIEITGLELTPSGVETAQLAAERYGFIGTFIKLDVAQEWNIPPADVVYSMHALEQMPTQYRAVLDQMCAHARKAVVLFEPVPDMWPGVAGFAGRLRARWLDRLPPGAVAGYDITRQALLPFGTALNRTNEIHIRP